MSIENHCMNINLLEVSSVVKQGVLAVRYFWSFHQNRMGVIFIANKICKEVKLFIVVVLGLSFFFKDLLLCSFIVDRTDPILCRKTYLGQYFVKLSLVGISSAKFIVVRFD